MKTFFALSNVLQVRLYQGSTLAADDACDVAERFGDVHGFTRDQIQAIFSALCFATPIDFSSLGFSPREEREVISLVKWCRGLFVRSGSALISADLNTGQTFVIVRKGA